MIKILISGYDHNFCKEIKTLGDWKKYNSKIVAMAVTEDEIFQHIEKNEPDLIISDIKFEKGNIFNVIKKIRKKGFDTKVIIATEYRSFDYMREAINLGVEKFISMPATQNAFSKTMGEIIKTVVDEKEDARKLKEHEVWKKERALAILAFDDKEMISGIKDYCDDVKKILSESQYVVFLVETDDVEIVNSRLQNIFEGERNYIGSFIGGDMVVGIQRFHSAASKTHIRTSLKSFFERFCDLCKKDKDINVLVNISSVMTTDSEISKGFEECLLIRKMHFIYDDLKVIFYEDIKDVGKDKKVPAFYNNNVMEEMINKEDIRKITQFFSELLLEIKKAPVYNTDAIIGFYQNIFIDIVKLRISLNSDISDISEFFNNMSKAKKLSELSDQIEEYAVSTVKFLHDIKLQKSLNPVNKAIYYIEQNYQNDIDLQMVSEFVGLVPAYFSRIFKKEAGCSFIQYVMKKRTEQAKWLLKNTDMKIYEICNKVGYNDTRYFIKMFKNITGETPMQFKRSQYRKVTMEE